MREYVRVAFQLRRKGAAFVLATRAPHGHPPVGGRVAVVGPAPIRVLLIGGDYAVGWGTASRAQALDGAIADVLHELTGRGVVVENRATPDVPLARAATSIGTIGAHSFDLTIWTPTFTEAGKQLWLWPWRLALEALAARVRNTSNSGLVLLGVPPLIGSQPIAILARFRAAAITRVISRVAAGDPHTVMVEPPAIDMHQIANPDGPRVYRAVAERLAPAMLHLLGIPARVPVR